MYFLKVVIIKNIIIIAEVEMLQHKTKNASDKDLVDRDFNFELV